MGTLNRPRMVGRRPRLTADQIAQCKAIAVQRATIPSNAALAAQFGVPLYVIRRAVMTESFGWLHSKQTEQKT